MLTCQLVTSKCRIIMWTCQILNWQDGRKWHLHDIKIRYLAINCDDIFQTSRHNDLTKKGSHHFVSKNGDPNGSHYDVVESLLNIFSWKRALLKRFCFFLLVFYMHNDDVYINYEVLFERVVYFIIKFC